MKRLHKILIMVVSALVLSGALYFFFARKCIPNFHTLREGVLYRSGQPRGLGLEFVRLFGIRTLINLRNPDSDGTPQEKVFAAEKGLNFYNFSLGDSHRELDRAVKRFLAIADDKSSWPILVHCSWGEERSGFLSAIYRLEYDRWTNEQALEETYRLGLEKGHMPIKENYIKSYRPRWAGEHISDIKPAQALLQGPGRIDDGKN